MLSFSKMLQIFGMLFFIVLIGAVFVVVTVMLGKPELLLLVVFLLLGCLLKGCFGKKQVLSYLQAFPLLGDAARILNSVEEFYQRHAPKTIVYYLLYPVTSTISFLLGSRMTRNELGKYFTLIHWIILILFIEGFVRTYQLSQVFGLSFAIKWAILEFVLVYFLCNFFAIPLIVCAIRLTSARCYRRLVFVASSTFVCLGVFFYYFSYVYQFDNLIPTNVILEKNLVQSPSSPDSFKNQMQETTLMFLKHHLPALQQKIENKEDPGALLETLNDKYQEALLAVCSYQENTLVHLTTNRNPYDLWGFVFIPMRDSIFFAFHYTPEKVTVYDSLSNMPPEEQEKFKHFWDQSQYRPSLVKQLARVIVQEAGETMKVLERPKASTQDIAEVQQESHLSELQRVPAQSENYVEGLNPSGVGKKAYETKAMFPMPKHYQQSVQEIRFLLGQLETFCYQPTYEDEKEVLALIKQIQEEWRPEWVLASKEKFWKAMDTFDKGKTSKKMPNYQELAEVAQRVQREFNSYLESNYFVVYSPAVTSFNFAKAIEFKLVSEHLGMAPDARSENITTQIFGFVWHILLWFFALCMPFHLALIVFSYLKYLPNETKANL